MKQSICYLGILACLAAPAAWPQSPQKREVTVVVLNAHAEPSEPVPGVRVSLSFVAGAEKVTDARDATNRSGQALLLVSPEAAQRDDLRLEISGVNDLVVFQPADGQLSGLPTSVTVRLLPKGSVLLLGPPQIEAMLQRLSIQNRAKNQEIHALKAELAVVQSQKPDDLTAAMTEWAKTNGFDLAEVDKQVQQWAEDIQKRKDQATANEKALAELALKHYGVAAQLFDQAADDIGQSMDDEEKRFLEERRKQLRELVDKKFQSANTYRLNLQFHQATLILTQARDRAAAEHVHYPEDAALRSIWLDAVLRLASARGDEGEVGEAGASAALLAQSIKDFQGLLQERSGPAERQDWAKAQIDLGIALLDQGVRSNGAQATDFLAQAVQAYRAALGVYTKASQPKEWARTESNLGNALDNQGKRGSGAHTAELFAQAVQAYRAALEVRTKADMPQEWATTQCNLGNTLVDEAERYSAEQATDLLAQAVQAFRHALEVETKTDDPEGWADAQNSLGIALMDQAERSKGPQIMDLSAQAEQAFKAALEVYTRAGTPQDWAMVQHNLGAILAARGAQSSGTQAIEFFTQAVQAFRSAQEVRTRTDLPQDWARTQINLAASLADLAVRSRGPQAMDLLAQAIAANRAVLEVYTKADLPQEWAAAEGSLGLAIEQQGELSSGTQATDLMSQGVDAYHAALQVFTKASMPQDWALVQNNLGMALRHLADRSSGAQAKDLLAQAIVAYRAALEVYTKADMPREWAMVEHNLANALEVEGDFPGAAKAIDAALEAFPNDTSFLQTGVSIYHDDLYDYDRAYQLTDRWLKAEASPEARLTMVEEDLTTSRFEDCEKQAASIDDAALPDPAGPFVLVRDTMKMACQWAAGQKPPAQQTAQALSLKSAQLQNAGWGVEGTRHFLGSSPAFAAGRASWIALFDSLEKGDGSAMAAALHQLEEVMKP
jgi:tetratricopeptide (TPR) repeat protein